MADFKKTRPTIFDLNATEMEEMLSNKNPLLDAMFGGIVAAHKEDVLEEEARIAELNRIVALKKDFFREGVEYCTMLHFVGNTNLVPGVEAKGILVNVKINGGSGAFEPEVLTERLLKDGVLMTDSKRGNVRRIQVEMPPDVGAFLKKLQDDGILSRFDLENVTLDLAEPMMNKCKNLHDDMGRAFEENQKTEESNCDNCNDHSCDSSPGVGGNPSE